VGTDIGKDEREDPFRSLLESTGAPEAGADGKSPFSNIEPRRQRSHLNDADRLLEARGHDAEADVAAGGALTVGPVDESLEALDRGRRR
jgi:hypothetical protein